MFCLQNICLFKTTFDQKKLVHLQVPFLRRVLNYGNHKFLIISDEKKKDY